MALYVLKFGGSSVATIERMQNVANIVAQFIRNGHKVIVVTSAMQGVTDTLVEKATRISLDINREYDAIINCGEMVAAGMLARTLQTTSIPAISLSAFQIPILAGGSHGNASILEVGSVKIQKCLSKNIIPVITGFQGISKDGDILTLGRGGSDATACAVSYFLHADECIIYTDVDGVYTGDPRIVLNAQLIPEISYDEMLELSFWGAKVLQCQSVSIAKNYQVKVKVLSSFVNSPGTIITNKTNNHNAITGIANSSNYNLVSINETIDCAVKIKENLYLVPKGTTAGNRHRNNHCSWY